VVFITAETLRALATSQHLSRSQIQEPEVQENMDIDPEQLIEELCELVAKETDYAELRRLITRLIESLDARQKQRDGKANFPSEKQST
jgi:hypothetical protein